MKAELQKRTKQIGLDAIKIIEKLPKNTSGWIVGKQIVRSATSIGANYRAACRAKSIADYINKLKIVEEESDETVYWLEIIEESEMLKKEITESLKSEISEIIKIIVTTIKTLRSKKLNQQ